MNALLISGAATALAMSYIAVGRARLVSWALFDPDGASDLFEGLAEDDPRARRHAWLHVMAWPVLLSGPPSDAQVAEALRHRSSGARS